MRQSRDKWQTGSETALRHAGRPGGQSHVGPARKIYYFLTPLQNPDSGVTAAAADRIRKPGIPDSGDPEPENRGPARQKKIKFLDPPLQIWPMIRFKSI